jgi:cell division protein FtsL
MRRFQRAVGGVDGKEKSTETLISQQKNMITSLHVLIGLLIFHIIQNDARLWQVTKELKLLRKDLAKKP